VACLVCSLLGFAYEVYIFLSSPLSEFRSAVGGDRSRFKGIMAGVEIPAY
jgi:hypothetical protein